MPLHATGSRFARFGFPAVETSNTKALETGSVRGVAMTLSNTSVGSWMDRVHGRGPQQDVASRGLR